MPTITTFEEKLESFKKCHNFVFFCQTWLVVCCTFTQLNCFVVFGKPMHWGAHIWASSYFETQHSLHRQNSIEEFKRLFWPDVTVRFFVFGSWNFIPIVSGNKFYETWKHNIRSNHIYPNTQNGKFSWNGCYFVPWTMNMLKMTILVKKEILMSTMTMKATKENLLAVGNEGVLVRLVKRSWQCLALSMVLWEITFLEGKWTIVQNISDLGAWKHLVPGRSCLPEPLVDQGEYYHRHRCHNHPCHHWSRHLVVLISKAEPLVERDGTVAVLVDRLELVRRASLMFNPIKLVIMDHDDDEGEDDVEDDGEEGVCWPATSRSQTSWGAPLLRWSSHQTRPQTPGY